MSGIPYSGGTIINTTFTTTVGTRQEIVTALEANLVAAGWTVISGAGTGTVLLRSAETAAPKSNSIRMRLLEVGSGNCAQIKMENDSGSLVSQAYYLLPAAAKVFRIIACRYNFFIFTPQPSTARGVVCGGTLYIPTFLEGVTTGSLGWIHGNGNSDTDVTIRNTFRTRLGIYTAQSNGWGWSSQIRNNALININDDSQSAGQVTTCHAPVLDLNNYLLWADGNTYPTREVVLGFGMGATGAQNQWQGIIHNVFTTPRVYNGDDTSVSAYDGHAWMSVTHANNGASRVNSGTIFAAIT